MFNKHSALFAWVDYKIRHIGIFPEPITEVYLKLFSSFAFDIKPLPEHEVFVSNADRRIAYSAILFEKNIRTIVGVARAHDVKVFIATQMVTKKCAPNVLASKY